MQFSRDENLGLLTSRSVERQMFVELFGLLVGLEDEWRAQGATQEEMDPVAFDWDMLESRGAVIFQQDSDGNIKSVIDAFMDCGVNTLQRALQERLGANGFLVMLLPAICFCANPNSGRVHGVLAYERPHSQQLDAEPAAN